MLLFKNLTIKNFLSVGAVTQAVALDGTPLTLVLGANADTNGPLSRNGAGKSTILQAISYALFAKPLTKIKIPNLINNINGKQMLVTLEFERDGKTYRIERGKKPDVTRFYVNGVESGSDLADENNDEAQGENKQTQHAIDRLVGMSHDLFKLILALNTFTEPFLKMSAAGQRDIMEELFGIMIMSHKGGALKDEMKTTTKQIVALEARIKALIEANDRIQTSISAAEAKVSNWDVDHDGKIASLVEGLEAMLALDFEAEISAFDALDAYMEGKRALDLKIDELTRQNRISRQDAERHRADNLRLTKQANEGVESLVSRIRTEQDRAVKSAERHRQNAANLAKERTELAAAEHDENCALCGQSIDGTDHHASMKAKLEAKLADLDRRAQSELAAEKESLAGIDELEAEATKIIGESETRKASLLADADAAHKLASQVELVVEAVDVDLAALVRERETYGPRPVLTFNSRDDVYKLRQERDRMEHALEVEISLENPHKGQVNDLKAALQIIDRTELDAATELFEHQECLLKLLMDKNSFIRRKLMNRNLSFVNQQMALYLEKLCLPHEVVFQSDLSVEISLTGRDYDFEQLSRGEMNRVIMATSWAFRDVFESMNQTVNLMWVDELLDQGMDVQGVEAALGILKDMTRKSNKNIFLISHKEELQSRIDRTLLVCKENDFTSFDTSGL